MTGLRRAAPLASTLINATFSALPTVSALLFLSTDAFGRFMLAYTCWAIAVSLCMSLVAEPWLRASFSREAASWTDYCTVLVTLSASTASLALLGTLTVLSPLHACGVGAAVGLATYRMGTRYYGVVAREWIKVLWGDAAGLIAFLTTLAVFLNVKQVSNLFALILAWLLGALCSTLLGSPKVSIARFWPTTKSWGKRHLAEIKTLGTDSLIVDVSSAIFPLLTSPILGIAGFGTYRAVSSCAMPVRLVLAPLRPSISHRKPEWYWRGSTVALVFGSAALTGAGVLLALLLAPHIQLLNGTVITGLSPFAVLIGTYVASDFVGTVFQFGNRMHLKASWVLYNRFALTVLHGVFPVIGALLWGVSGAIYAFVGATIAGNLASIGLSRLWQRAF